MLFREYIHTKFILKCGKYQSFLSKELFKVVSHSPSWWVFESKINSHPFYLMKALHFRLWSSQERKLVSLFLRTQRSSVDSTQPQWLRSPRIKTPARLPGTLTWVHFSQFHPSLTRWWSFLWPSLASSSSSPKCTEAAKPARSITLLSIRAGSLPRPQRPSMCNERCTEQIAAILHY